MNVLNELINLVDNEYSGLEEHKPCMDYLTNLKRIEEKIGIDITVLFQALENGVYIKRDKAKRGYVFRSAVHLKKWRKNGKYVLFYSPCSRHKLFFEDYGTTWSIDRKEIIKK